MIIEFAGLPGAGKSVLCDRVTAELGCDPAASHTARRPNAHHESFRHHPRLTAIVTTHVLRSRRSWPDRSFAIRRTLVTVGVVARARRSPSPAPLLLSEGVCQRAFTVFVDGAGTADRAVVRRYLAAAPWPDVVIAIRVRPETAIRRTRDRGYGRLSSRFDGLEDARLAERFAAGQRLLLDAVADVRQLSAGAVRTLIVDGEHLDTAAAAVGLALPSLLFARPEHRPARPTPLPEVSL